MIKLKPTGMFHKQDVKCGKETVNATMVNLTEEEAGIEAKGATEEGRMTQKGSEAKITCVGTEQIKNSRSVT